MGEVQITLSLAEEEGLIRRKFTSQQQQQQHQYQQQQYLAQQQQLIQVNLQQQQQQIHDSTQSVGTSTGGRTQQYLFVADNIATKEGITKDDVMNSIRSGAFGKGGGLYSSRVGQLFFSNLVSSPPLPAVNQSNSPNSLTGISMKSTDVVGTSGNVMNRQQSNPSMPSYSGNGSSLSSNSQVSSHFSSSVGTERVLNPAAAMGLI